jgi:hypothetical protein
MSIVPRLRNYYLPEILKEMNFLTGSLCKFGTIMRRMVYLSGSSCATVELCSSIETGSLAKYSCNGCSRKHAHCFIVCNKKIVA